MPGTTPNFGLRYPASTDPPNVSTDIANLASDVDSKIIPPVVNGQWIKGVGGAAVWQPITGADITGLQAPVPFMGGGFYGPMTCDGGWHGFGSGSDTAGFQIGHGAITELLGPSSLYTQIRWIVTLTIGSLNGNTGMNFNFAIGRPWYGGNLSTYGFNPPQSTGTWVFDSGWTALTNYGTAGLQFLYMINIITAAPSAYCAAGTWIR